LKPVSFSPVTVSLRRVCSPTISTTNIEFITPRNPKKKPQDQHHKQRTRKSLRPHFPTRENNTRNLTASAQAATQVLLEKE